MTIRLGIDRQLAIIIEHVTPYEQSCSDLVPATAVLTRAMLDNPSSRALFGKEPTQRARRLYRSYMAGMQLQANALIASSGGAVVGVATWSEPGVPKRPVWEHLVGILRLLPNGPSSTLGIIRLSMALAANDIKQPRWYLGPVGVDPHLQGRGIGSELLRRFCERVDAARGTAYLETDKPENVTFYTGFGFRVVAQTRVLGESFWFMLRPPASSSF